MNLVEQKRIYTWKLMNINEHYWMQINITERIWKQRNVFENVLILCSSGPELQKRTGWKGVTRTVSK